VLESSLKLLKRISEYGYEAYLVGGFPRDLLLNRKTSDIDICTNATPMELINIFPDAEATNFAYGCLIVYFENIKFEITTFRKDIGNINNRHPSKVIYVDNLNDDLKRRDFTINTICIDKNGNQIDLLDGKKDINKKIIRMVGNPKIRLQEDALRILRAVRFATVLDFSLDENLKTCIKKYSHLLKKLSYDKKREELDLIFSNTNKEKGIKLLCELKLIDALEIPKLKEIKITPSMLVTWSSLDVLDKYKFTSNERELINQINEIGTRSVLNRKILYKYGLYVCMLASELQGVDKTILNEEYKKMPIHSKLDIAVKPEEICKILNKKPGSFLRNVINDLEEKILSGEIPNTKEGITKYLNTQ
jgi:tRNA nucleotidyltransferase (CCA-adding enzyme)